MNQIERLAKQIQRTIPGVTLDLDKSTVPTGSWWLDVTTKGRTVVIEWRPDKGFGISTASSAGYGEGPHEIHLDEEMVLDRVTHLLVSGETTLSPRELMLKSLRQSKDISQEQLAKVLKVRQSSVSKLENRTDMQISTLRRVISHLGGELEIRAKFPEGSVRLIQFDGKKRTSAKRMKRRSRMATAVPSRSKK